MPCNIMRILYKKTTSQNSAEDKRVKKKTSVFSVSYLFHIVDMKLQYDGEKEQVSRAAPRPCFSVRPFC